ncbi:MAG: PIN domain-containing protein [Firmicutes bacterium]|nr:PIN domain-containing protein [Bacillota bacterium]
MIKLYFDSCIYNRPFDDQTQSIIQNETNAIIDIINYTQQNNICIYSSAIVKLELEKNENSDKKIQVQLFYDSLKTKNIQFNIKINDRAKELGKQYNIKYKDGLHIAYCELENIDYLITTDKNFINASARANLKLKVTNPKDYIEGGE